MPLVVPSRFRSHCARAHRRCAQLAGLLLLAAASPILAQAVAEGEQVYIVQMTEPAASRALALSARTPGRRHISSASEREAMRRAGERLSLGHDAMLASVGAGGTKLRSFRYTLNGFTARLTPAQARALKSNKAVRNVWLDRPKYLQTNASSGFLGLRDSNGGLWQDRKLLGKGVIIGVIDSGIAVGHPQLKDTRDARRPRICKSAWAETSLLGLWLCKRFRNRPPEVTFTRPTDWAGTCEAGDRFESTNCNGKLIGARYYLDGFLQQYALDPSEFRSPRDADGHGTHIATTAAGNAARATLGGSVVDNVIGIAPSAHVAVYKACWLEPGQSRGTCATSDLVAAIEDAVADGVDIINYSVGSDDDIVDPDDIALLAAADVGVLAVTAAGNEGPTPESVLSPAAAPWTLAVGASSRTGARYRDALRVSAPPAVAGDYDSVEAAFTPALRDRAALKGKLVLYDDGVKGVFSDGSNGSVFDGCETARNGTALNANVALLQRTSAGCDFQTKLTNAERAGATAVVVFSDQPGEPVAMKGTRGSVSIPALMIGRTDGEKLKQQLDDGADVQVTLDKKIIVRRNDTGNIVWQQSARGPNFWAPDILKPDVVAPGVAILAGHTPDVANNQRGESYQYLTGTSMAVPHVAGLAALLREAHPDWSPAAIRSALMTTARQNLVLTNGTTPADPFDIGAGHVVPNNAVAPGLVYDTTTDEYEAFLCGRDDGTVDATVCQELIDQGLPTEAAQLNQPAIAQSRLVHESVVTRRVTNVGPAAQFTATVEAPSTIDIDVEPSVLNLGSGESAEFDVRITTSNPTFDAWQFGAMTWTSDIAAVRSPIAIRALPLAAPAAVGGTGTDGSLTFDVRVDFAGSYQPVLAGLELPQLTNGSVSDDPGTYQFRQPGQTLPASVRRVPVTVPPNTRLLRIALFAVDTVPATADLDLYLYSCPNFSSCDPNGRVSANLDSNETIDILDPPPGDYYVDVHGFDAAGGSATFALSAWTLGADLGNTTVSAPGSVTAGQAISVSLGWQNLGLGRSLGLIDHQAAGANVGTTVIQIDN